MQRDLVEQPVLHRCDSVWWYISRNETGLICFHMQREDRTQSHSLCCCTIKVYQWHQHPQLCSLGAAGSIIHLHKSWQDAVAPNLCSELKQDVSYMLGGGRKESFSLVLFQLMHPAWSWAQSMYSNQHELTRATNDHFVPETAMFSWQSVTEMSVSRLPGRSVTSSMETKAPQMLLNCIHDCEKSVSHRQTVDGEEEAVEQRGCWGGEDSLSDSLILYRTEV